MNKEDFYQIFIVGTGEFLDNLLSNGLGGVIFFSKDITSERNFKNLISNIKEKSESKLLLSIDQEGGRVERTENIYPRRLSAKLAYEKGEMFLKTQTEQLAEELVNLGINLNFAPVADVNTNPNNPIIGERAFANNPSDVINGVNIVAKTYLKKGVIPCVKHFPGHGDTNQDSHKTLPEISLSLNEMEKLHLPPFKFAADENFPMIMIAHLNCHCFGEPNIPTSLSKNAISYLRNNLKYNGVIITDDMNMGGVNYLSPLEAAKKALKAGINILLYRQANLETFNLIEKLKEEIKFDKELEIAVEQSIERIKILKRNYL